MNKMNHKSINGKKFVEELAMCETKESVFELVNKIMSATTFKDRLKNVNDNDLLLNLDASKAKLNASSGCRTSNQDCVNMAATKFKNITGKGVKNFKIEANKFVTKKEKFAEAKKSNMVAQAYAAANASASIN